jgi:hypothetical protein
MRDGCPDCRGSDEVTWCPGCGVYWAHGVAARVASRAPWPPYEGHMREIALTKVRDLAGNAWARETFARECWRRAAEAWAELIVDACGCDIM